MVNWSTKFLCRHRAPLVQFTSLHYFRRFSFVLCHDSLSDLLFSVAYRSALLLLHQLSFVARTAALSSFCYATLVLVIFRVVVIYLIIVLLWSYPSQFTSSSLSWYYFCWHTALPSLSSSLLYHMLEPLLQPTLKDLSLNSKLDWFHFYQILFPLLCLGSV